MISSAGKIKESRVGSSECTCGRGRFVFLIMEVRKILNVEGSLEKRLEESEVSHADACGKGMQGVESQREGPEGE